MRYTYIYFTKFGDGGADLLPISQLTKAEVKYLAKLVGVPDSIINKKPSAELMRRTNRWKWIRIFLWRSWFLFKSFN
ncbi:hypothetical protein NW739_01635 [Mycoplasmopsis felis]|nr:hypothetical protein [Mycoplasmopsis felis]MCU9939504.1 hypothetical protein [Mycoplasmopsis felis]